MNTRLLIFIFISINIIPQLLHSQFTQQGPKLVGTGMGGVMVYQGNALALSSDGNTAVVGGYGDNNSTGAIWVFTRSGGVWTQQGSKLVGTGAVGNARQGASVSISADGNTIVEGGYNDDVNGVGGAIWVFTRSGGVWTQQGSKLVGTGAVGNAFQGVSVSISSDGNTVIEGGYQDNSQTGAVWVFTRSGGVWSQLGSKLVGTGGTQFPAQGYSVSISADGNTIIDGGNQDNSAIGAIWIFNRTGNVWTQQGTKLIGTGYVGQPQQGSSVSISSDGNTILFGGFDSNTNIGGAWVFTRSGGIWTQQGPRLIGTGAVGQGAQGRSVSMSADGNTAVVGGPFDNNLAGALWIFTRNNGSWTQLGSKLVGTGSTFGQSAQGIGVAISAEGNTILGGGSLDSSGRGATWVFTRSNFRLSNSHNNLNKAILGNQSTLDTITIATDISSYFISNVTVTIDTISYPNDGDLEISLLHASNIDTLVYQVGGSGANFIGTVLNDSAATLISNGTAPFTGNFKPSKPLSKFINFEPAGIWILKVYDRTTGHTGTFKAWTLTLDLSPNPLAVINLSQQVPNGFRQSQNYPNPFNPNSKIKFQIAKLSDAKLIVFDILGREVETLVNEQLKPGIYEVDFDGSKLSSGVYFYKLVTGEFTETRKMILIK